MALVIDIFLLVLLVYLVLGILYSVWFYWKDAPVIDAGTQQTPWHFKAIIYPGVVLFWVILFRKARIQA